MCVQASAYKSADVVSTLRQALMVDGQLSMTFNNEEEVLAYLGNKILLPTWKDPVCGDGARPTPHFLQIIYVYASPLCRGAFRRTATMRICWSHALVPSVCRLCTRRWASDGTCVLVQHAVEKKGLLYP